MKKIIKLVIMTLLVFTSIFLVSCSENKVKKYFVVMVHTSDFQNFGDDIFLNISPKSGYDLRVNGKVVVKKIKISCREDGREKFLTNDYEFAIELDETGYLKIGNWSEYINIRSLRTVDGTKIFQDANYKSVYSPKIIDLDAYFIGTIVKK